jgi:SAM-dependent methyltransferase
MLKADPPSLATPGENIKANRQKWDRDHPWPEDGDEWKGQSVDCKIPYPEWKQSLIDHLIAPSVTADMHVLEIAPGHGRWTEALVARAQKATVVDLSQTCLDFCRARFAGKNVDYFLTDGASLPPELTGSIDFLWSFDAFVHMAPGVIEAYLREIARVLKPGARAIVHHSGIENLDAHEQRGHQGWRSAVNASMVRGFAEEAGLKVLSQISFWDDARGIGVPRHNDKITTVQKV